MAALPLTAANILVVLGTMHLGLLFATSGVSKLLSPTQFRDQLILHNVLPTAISSIVARVIPVTEFGLGVVLFAGIEARVTSATAAALFCVFAWYRVEQVRVGDTPQPCGCFGAARVADAGETLSTEMLGLLVNLSVAVALAVFASDTFAYSPVVSMVMGSLIALIIVALLIARAKTSSRHDRHRPVAATEAS